MKRLIFAAAIFWAGVASAQVTLTGDVRNAAGQGVSLTPNGLFVQSCNGGAGGIVGQGSCVLPTSSGGGSGTAVTVADGADVTQGAKADAKSTATDTTPVTVMQVLKEISAMEQAPATRAVTVSTNVGTLPLIQATASVPITFTSAGGPTQIIAASGSTKIYITHWDVVFSGAGTFALVTGTGTNCGTNTAYLTGASGHPAAFAANGGISAGSGLGPILITGAGGEVCAITTGAVDSSGSIAYAQF